MKPRPPETDCNSATEVITLAGRVDRETIEITELEPYNGVFVGKRINPDGSTTGRPGVTKWYQRVACVPATIPYLFIYLREARERNVCLIRGAPTKLERQPTLRQKAGLYGSSDRGDHGFLDTPTRLLPLDFDGVKINWRTDPEQALRTIVAQMGEPWASTSFVWFFSAGHGLELDAHKCWTGRISDGVVRVRVLFITDRALNESEAVALIDIARARVPALDRSTCYTIQPNYIQRPYWVEHPDRDVLGDIPTIGWIKGAREYLAIPDNLAHTARWAQAQGHSGSIADHPDAKTAVCSIGSNERLREHMTAAIVHLLRASPPPDANFDTHSPNIVAKLRKLIEQHREQIASNLNRGRRRWDEVQKHLSEMPSWAVWCLNHQNILRGQTIKLITTQDLAKRVDATTAAEAIFARVARIVGLFHRDALTNEDLENPPVKLLVSATGSRKSTEMRAAAVQYVTERPEKTVVILMPRHKLGDEQIKQLAQEHPTGNWRAAVWRGRHAWDPDAGNGRMCRRSKEVKAVEQVMLDVEASLCKRGRGDKAAKCPFYDTCAYQQQRKTSANIWFAAHECAVHEMPTAFGDVGWVIFDESPLDAFTFGIDLEDQVTLELDTLNTPLLDQGFKSGDGGAFEQARKARGVLGSDYKTLTEARRALYHTLNKLRVPSEFYRGVAPSRGELDQFIEPTYGGNGIYAKDMHSLTFRGKAKPEIRPDISEEQLKTKLKEAAINGTIKKEVKLWRLVAAMGGGAVDDAMAKGIPPQEMIRLIETEAVNKNRLYGRIQVHRGKEGRVIRMAGLEELAKGWEVPTLICDATGDAELLKAIWPQLEEPEPHGWEQLPRPDNVRIFQCVNRAISKSAVAIEGKNEQEAGDRAAAARRLYAAILRKALDYGGEAVGVIVYKSTKDWILKNCFVPKWMTLLHWGDLTGTNTLQSVRALFVIGRPLAAAEDVSRMTEALFGDYIAERDYRKRAEAGEIPTIPDAEGNNCVLVGVWEHQHPIAERLRRKITEGELIQAVGRARAGLRGKGEPLDIHLSTNVPLPELGAVEPVLWSELAAGLDGLMLARSGCWLRNVADAVRAIPGLFTAAGLRAARSHMRGGDVFPIEIPIGKTSPPPTILPVAHYIGYQRQGAGYKPAEAVFLKGVADPRGWLEARLGPLAYFEVKQAAGQDGTGGNDGHELSRPRNQQAFRLPGQ